MARKDLYTPAIVALEKEDASVTQADRDAVASLVEQLREENNRGTGARLQHFHTMCVGYHAIVEKNKVVRQVFDNFDTMPRLLDSFAAGKSIKRLKEAVIWYVRAWKNLSEGEHEAYSTMRASIEKMKRHMRV